MRGEGTLALEMDAAVCVVSAFLPLSSVLCVKRQCAGDGQAESLRGLARLGFLLSLVSVTQVLRLNAMAAMCA